MADVWQKVNASPGWSTRAYMGAVVLSDGSIVIAGGRGVPGNDVWRSTDQGLTWTQQTAAASWTARESPVMLVLPDDSILIMGGWSTGARKDVWRSTDQGVTWTQQTSNAGWARTNFSGVVLPDGSVVVMGGKVGTTTFLNDVWRSTDQGVTWTRQTAAASWSARSGHCSIVKEDGSILLMGGWRGSSAFYNDVWRSADRGVTWSQISPAGGAEWAGRFAPAIVYDRHGDIWLTGGGISGGTAENDTWKSTDGGVSWSQGVADADWSRIGHSMVVTSDNKLLLMGGVIAISGGTTYADVWLPSPLAQVKSNATEIWRIFQNSALSRLRAMQGKIIDETDTEKF